MSNLFKLCKNGNYDEVLEVIDKGANEWNWGLIGACEGGNMKIVKLMIKKGAYNLNTGLVYASVKGHMKIVRLLIKKGANDFNNGLFGAYIKGYMKIVKFMIEKGSIYLNCINLHKINKLLYLNTNIKTLIRHEYYKHILKNIKKSQNMILQYNY